MGRNSNKNTDEHIQTHTLRTGDRGTPVSKLFQYVNDPFWVWATTWLLKQLAKFNFFKRFFLMAKIEKIL